MKYSSSYFLGLFILFAFNSLNAQNSENSPLSRYGIGDLRPISTGWMSGMANAGVAFTSDQFYNPLNPAASAFLRQTDVEFGLNVKFNSLEDGNGLRSRDWSGGLTHLFLAIPLRNTINEILDRKTYNNSMSLQFGLAPYSAVGYKSELIDSSNKENVLKRFLQGDGLINNFFLGFSYRYKNLSAGIQMNYLFGNLNYVQHLLLSGTPASHDSYLTDKFHISSLRPGIGLMYQKVINQKEIDKDNTQRKKLISVGLTLDAPANFTSSHTALHQTRFQESIEIVDTILYINEQESKGQLPYGLKAGVYYSHKDKLGLMSSVHYEAWQDAEWTQGIAGITEASTSIQLGGWYKPGLNSYDKFFKKSIYRFGAYFGNDYRSFNGDQARNLGITFGWGFPIVFIRQDAMVHLNFDLGQRNLENRLTENYFMIHFSIGINDNEWFLKRRYN